MYEIMPIGAGLVLGCSFALASRSWAATRLARVLWVVVAGILSTVLSGEFHTNWGFAIVDIGEVGLAAWVGTYLTAMLLPRIRRRGSAQS